jgi:hypothetical protein
MYNIYIDELHDDIAYVPLVALLADEVAIVPAPLLLPDAMSFSSPPSRTRLLFSSRLQYRLYADLRSTVQHRLTTIQLVLLGC